MRKSTSKRSGQTTAEYAIIVALVAVSSIAIIMIFGEQIKNLFAGTTTAIAEDGHATVDSKKTDADTEKAKRGSTKGW